MISVLMDNYPFRKHYIELPLCGEQMDSLLYYGTLRSDVEYVGARDGKGRISEILRGLHMTGEDLRELNLLAYVLTRLDSASQQRDPTIKIQALEQCLTKEKYSLGELINQAFAVDAPIHPRRYTGENLDQLILWEREAYGPHLDMKVPRPEPWRKIGELAEGKLYWMTGIDQFCEYQAFIRQGDSLLQCPAWHNSDQSIRFSEIENAPNVYIMTDLPSPELTLAEAEAVLEELDYSYQKGTLPDGTCYEYISSCLLPEDFAQKGCETQQMGGIK